MDADYNRYDAEHVCTAHPNMTREQWEEIYRHAWDMYYSPEHIETILRRGAATGTPMSNLAGMLLLFSAAGAPEKGASPPIGFFPPERPAGRPPTLSLEAGCRLSLKKPTEDTPERRYHS